MGVKATAGVQFSKDAVGNTTGLVGGDGSTLTVAPLASMTKWRKALAEMRDGTRNARLAIIGDSTTVGSGVGGVGYVSPNGRAKNYVNKLTDMINTYQAPASCQAFFGAQNVTTMPTFDTRIAYSGGWITNVIGAAVGGTVFLNSSDNAAFTFTPATDIDTFKLWYVKNTTTASMDTKVDAGGVTTTATAGTKSVGSLVIPAGSLGQHTLSISRSTGASGTLYILGIEAYDSTKKQIQILPMGWSGSKVTDQVVANNPWDVTNAVPTYAPDLTLIMLTINDWNLPTPLTTYQSGLQTLINAAKTTGDVILMSGVPTIASTTSLAQQRQYVDVVQQLAASNGLLFIDNWRRFGSQEAGVALNFYTDTLHPSSSGYSELASSIYSQLSRQL